MKEYTILFKKGLAKGLRNSKHNPRNEGALIQAKGVIQESKELFNHPEFENFDISTLDAQTFPFPQVFQLREWTVICTPTKIYTYDGTTLTLVYTSAEGSTWSIGDFYNFLILTNGQELLTLDPEDGTWSKYLDCAIPTCLCLCDVNGQLFVGGPEVSVSAGWLGD